MRDYEVVYIFRPEMESEAVEDRLGDHHGRLDGEITAVEHWGQRKLAFEIEGERSGYYVVAQFRAEPASLSGFEQGLKHDEELIRHLVVLSEGEMAAPPSQRRSDEDEKDEKEKEEEKEDDDEGEDDEDEDDEDEDEGHDEEEDEDEGDEEEEQDEDEDEDDGEEGDEDDDRDEEK